MLQFLTSNFPSPIPTTLLLIHTHSSHCPHILHIVQHIFLYLHQIYHLVLKVCVTHTWHPLDTELHPSSSIIFFWNSKSTSYTHSHPISNLSIQISQHTQSIPIPITYSIHNPIQVIPEPLPFFTIPFILAIPHHQTNLNS